MDQDQNQPELQASTEDVLDIELSEDDDEAQESDDNTEDAKEDKAIVAKDKEDEEEDEIPEFVEHASYKKILKDYPDLFTKYPSLKTAYFRDQEFISLFPTIEDAKEAESKASQLDRFERDLLDGNIENVFRAINESDSESFNKVVDNLLPTLQRVNERAFQHVAGSIVSDLVYTMLREAKSETLPEETRDLINQAAQLVNQFVFGTSQFKPAQRLSKQEHPEENKLKEERANYNRQRLEDAQQEISTTVRNQIRASIEQYIDRKGSMDSYVKRNAVRDCLEAVEDALINDAAMSKQLDALWRDAAENNYRKDKKDKIRGLVLQRAKQILPNKIREARSAAMGSRSKRVSDNEERDKNPLTARKTVSSSESNRPTSSKSKDRQPGESTSDYLARVMA